jgi:hypothetical protein
VLFLLEVNVRFEPIEPNVPELVAQGIVEEANGTRGLGDRAGSNLILLKEGYIKLVVEVQVVPERRSLGPAADDSNLPLRNERSSLNSVFLPSEGADSSLQAGYSIFYKM